MEHTPQIDSVYYLRKMLNPETFKEYLPKALEILGRYQFDAIAFRGTSGALVGIPLAHLLDKTMLVVRKSGEDSHSGSAVEGDRGAYRYIIADDIISSGATVWAIVQAVKKFAPHAECIGTLEWLRLNRSEPDLTPVAPYMLLDTHLFDHFGNKKKYAPWNYETKFVNSKETTNEKPQQKAAQASKETLSTFQVFYSPVYPRGLSGLAERYAKLDTQAIAREKQKQAEGFNYFIGKRMGVKTRPNMNW